MEIIKEKIKKLEQLKAYLFFNNGDLDLIKECDNQIKELTNKIKGRK